jgi:hypothetical protein
MKKTLQTLFVVIGALPLLAACYGYIVTIDVGDSCLASPCSVASYSPPYTTCGIEYAPAQQPTGSNCSSGPDKYGSYVTYYSEGTCGADQKCSIGTVLFQDWFTNDVPHLTNCGG